MSLFTLGVYNPSTCVQRRAVRQAGRDQDSVHSLTPSAADAASHNSAELETSSTVSIPPESTT